ncbi:MAG TPA: hypothetical protein VF211_10910 [Burkholderiales bacterium]
MSETPRWEKQGNAAWVACPRCARWFPVDPQLLEARRIALSCPGCDHGFMPDEARERA